MNRKRIVVFIAMNQLYQVKLIFSYVLNFIYDDRIIFIKHWKM